MHDDSEHQDNDANEEEQEEEEDDLDEVIGYHFMECTTLFVAYIYVNSGNLLFSVWVYPLLISVGSCQSLRGSTG